VGYKLKLQNLTWTIAKAPKQVKKGPSHSPRQPQILSLTPLRRAVQD